MRQTPVQAAKIRPGAGATLASMPRFFLPGRPSCFSARGCHRSRGQHPDELAVMTFNIRYDNPGDDLLGTAP